MTPGTRSGRRRRCSRADGRVIAVYETNYADQVAANIKAANRMISRAVDLDADTLAAELKQVEKEAAQAGTTAPASGSET